MIGTLVWDRIVPPGRTDPDELEGTWGGLGYSVSSAAAALPPGWSVAPVVKVGRDLAEEACVWLASIPRVVTSAVQVVDERNNRVTLDYRDHAERVERLEGGVPPWTWVELEPLIRGYDALLVNFISGHEADLETCRRLRAGYPGPIHADLHSLFLGSAPDGTRIPRPLPEPDEWFACFDSVQMNEVEARLCGASPDDLEAFLARVLEAGPDVAVVTLGAAGVAWARRAHAGSSSGARTETGTVTIRAPRQGDPTGCGDVWGAAFSARRAADDPVDRAAEIATRLATRSVEHRGADGLYDILDREVSH